VATTHEVWISLYGKKGEGAASRELRRGQKPRRDEEQVGCSKKVYLDPPKKDCGL